MADLFEDTIPSILQTKKPVISPENEKEYVPFIVNRALSFHMDCVMQANQMNMMPDADKLLQYQYLLNTIRSYKRPFHKWHKREDDENLEIVKEYYQYSNEKAKEALVVLSHDQLEEIKKTLNKGGLNAKLNRINRGETKRA